MKPTQVRKLKTLGFVCFFACFAGVIYQLINEKRLDHNSVIVGLPLGLVFGWLELVLLPKAHKWYRYWSFTKMLVFKTLLYTVVIYIVTISLTLVVGLSEGHALSELRDFLIAPSQLVLVFYTLVVYGLLVFLLQINQLVGEGVLWKFIRGKYHLANPFRFVPHI